jgi:hypothetical protein
VKTFNTLFSQPGLLHFKLQHSKSTFLKSSINLHIQTRVSTVTVRQLNRPSAHCQPVIIFCSQDKRESLSAASISVSVNSLQLKLMSGRYSVLYTYRDISLKKTFSLPFSQVNELHLIWQLTEHCQNIIQFNVPTVYFTNHIVKFAKL